MTATGDRRAGLWLAPGPGHLASCVPTASTPSSPSSPAHHHPTNLHVSSQGSQQTAQRRCRPRESGCLGEGGGPGRSGRRLLLTARFPLGAVIAQARSLCESSSHALRICSFKHFKLAVSELKAIKTSGVVQVKKLALCKCPRLISRPPGQSAAFQTLQNSIQL